MKLARVVVFVAVIVFAPSLLLSFQGPGCGKDCASCHSLTKEEAGKMLKIDVTNVSQAPAKGLWEVEGTQNGNKVKVYVDYGKKFIVPGNALIPIERIGKQPEMRKVDIGSIPLTGTMLVGDAKAKHKVIVFSDPDCPYCRKLHQEMKKLTKERKDIAFYIKLFPLPMHPNAYGKTKTVLCKNSPKLLDDAFEGKEIPQTDCDTKALDDNIKLAEKLGIGGTPTIILPDGRVIPGYVDGPSLIKLIETQQ